MPQWELLGVLLTYFRYVYTDLFILKISGKTVIRFFSTPCLVSGKSSWHILCCFLFFFFFFFPLFWAAPSTYGGPQAMGPIGELPLPACLPAYATATAIQVRAESVTYTTAHSNAGSLTHWARPEIEPTTSWFLVGFISMAPRWELPNYVLSNLCSHSLCLVTSHSFFIIYLLKTQVPWIT